MKKIILLLALFISGFAFSQIQEVTKTAPIIYDKVDKAAEFPGGNYAFKSKIMNNFDMKAVDGMERRDKISCEVNFVIDKVGKMIDVKVNGKNWKFNDEALRAVLQIKKRWIPAELNNEKVNSRYSIPLSMKVTSQSFF